MVDIVEKCKKVKPRSIKWDQVIWQLKELGFDGVQLAYFKFIQNHPYIKSKSRCAYNVLKKYFSTPLLRQARKEFKFDLYDYDVITRFLLVGNEKRLKKSDWIIRI